MFNPVGNSGLSGNLVSHQAFLESWDCGVDIEATGKRKTTPKKIEKKNTEISYFRFIFF